MGEIDLKTEIEKLMNEFGREEVLDAIEKLCRLELLKAAAKRMNIDCE